MDLGLRDRVAIVGGGSEGIGFAAARLLALEGCRVVIAARRDERLEERARELADAAPETKVVGVPCDMSVADDVRLLVSRTVEEFGALDIIVNNAGGPPPGPFEQHDDAAWRKAFDTNLMSVVWMVREALPHLEQSDQARIINITSTAVKEPIDGLILSNSIRLGTTGLAKSLSRELGRSGITVNNVGPGLTLTGRVRPVIEAQSKAENRSFDEMLQARAKQIPLRRLAEPDDIAGIIVFLASAQARHISGQTILVDGGATGSTL